MKVAQWIADGMWSRLAHNFEPMPDLNPSALQLIAHHEAAHIVAGWVAGAALGGATVHPAGERLFPTGELRPVIGLALFYIGGNGRSWALDDVVATLAGPAGARKFDPSCRYDGGDYDRVQVEAYLDATCRSAEVADLVRAECKARAVRLVEDNWDYISALAEALLERHTLDSSELRDILADVTTARAIAATPDCRAAWAAVEARAASFKSITEST